MQLKHEKNAATSHLESDIIDLTKAQRIAEGGTHVLYRFADAPYVIKLMKQNPNRKELLELENKYAVLYDCFDKENKQRCIREQHRIVDVLLSESEKEPQRRAVAIVPYEKCFKSEVKFDFKIEPTELDPYLIEHHQALFASANRTLLGQDNAEVHFNFNGYDLIDPTIGAILKRLDTDLELRETMAEFLNHYRDFYQKTNIILDAMGFENILFFKDEQNHWQFKIGSVIKHDTGRYTRELYAAIHDDKPVELNFVNFTHTYFSPANIRAVNACALMLNLPPVIADVTIDTNDLLKVCRDLPLPERMLAYARHGDFDKVETLLWENKARLCMSLRDFWAYPLIADEYVKQQQSPKALGRYLTLASQLPVILPEKEEEAKRVSKVKSDLIERRDLHYKKTIPSLSEVGLWSLTQANKETIIQEQQHDHSPPG